MSSGGLLRSGPSDRVGIVLLTGIGDVVHGLALANDLKRDDPSREVVWIAEPAPADVVRNHPSVDHVVVFRKSGGLAGLMQLRRDLARVPCDLTVNLIRYGKGLPGALFSGAPRSRRISLPRRMTRDGVHLFHGHRLPDQPWCHTQDLFLKMRTPLGLPEDGPVEWGISFTEGERAAFRPFVDGLRDHAAGRPVVGLVPATANPAKDWIPERWVELAGDLLEAGRLPLLIGGPSERERAIEDAVLTAHAEVRSGLGRGVRDMMLQVDEVDVLVSADTGPLHLAHALGTPVVGLFGHTNPWRVGPWRDFHDLVIDRYTEPGAPRDPSRYDPKHGRMERISSSEIAETVEVALERYVPASRGPSATRPEGAS